MQKDIEIDKELVRNLSSDKTITRFDILGLASGKYDVKVVTSSNQILEMKNEEILIQE